MLLKHSFRAGASIFVLRRSPCHLSGLPSPIRPSSRGTTCRAYRFRICGHFRWANRSDRHCARGRSSIRAKIRAKTLSIFVCFDTVCRQFASEPLVAVEVDLDLQREPGLHANVDEPQVAIHDAVALGCSAAASSWRSLAPRYSNGRPCFRARASAWALTRSALDNRNGLTPADTAAAWRPLCSAWCGRRAEMYWCSPRRCWTRRAQVKPGKVRARHLALRRKLWDRDQAR